MEALARGKAILDTMLGHLGFVVTVEATEDEGGPCLQVLTEDPQALTGPGGERLDEIQYLVNRILQMESRGAPRIRIDVEHFRAMREDELVAEARRLAETVKRTGQPAKMRPLNSYFRRVVHNAFLDDPDVLTWSPQDSARLKRITLMRRRRDPEAPPAEGGPA